MATQSLSEQLEKLSESVIAQTKIMNDVCAQLINLVASVSSSVVAPPSRCYFCRGKHDKKECSCREFMEEISAKPTDIEGIFEASSSVYRWIYAVPKKQYPILIGYRYGGSKLYSLDFFAGKAYQKANMTDCEFFTRHEFLVIQDRDPDLFDWISSQNICTIK